MQPAPRVAPVVPATQRTGEVKREPKGSVSKRKAAQLPRVPDVQDVQSVLLVRSAKQAVAQAGRDDRADRVRGSVHDRDAKAGDAEGHDRKTDVPTVREDRRRPAKAVARDDGGVHAGRNAGDGDPSAVGGPAAGVVRSNEPVTGWTPLTRAEVRSPVTHEEIVKWCQENRGQRIRYRALKRFVLSASKNVVIKAVEEALR